MAGMHDAASFGASGGPVATASPDTTIAYATPVPRGSPVTAGAVILLGGLGLVFLGGCFLIGALVVTEAGRENFVQGKGGLTTSMVLLLCVLYLATLGCFAGAVALLVAGTRALLRVVRGGNARREDEV
jgi:hypothetical protein